MGLRLTLKTQRYFSFRFLPSEPGFLTVQCFEKFMISSDQGGFPEGLGSILFSIKSEFQLFP